MTRREPEIFIAPAGTPMPEHGEAPVSLEGDGVRRWERVEGAKPDDTP